MHRQMERGTKGQASGKAAAHKDKRIAAADVRLDVGPAFKCSRVVSLYDRPYPVQFRSQGATAAWEKALGSTDVWERWKWPQMTAWAIRQELIWQLDHMSPFSFDVRDAVERTKANRMLAVEVSANLKYHLSKGTVIETTPALETLLTNSDMDLDLPMQMVAPPYAAQYLRFGPTATRYLHVPDSDQADRVFDGAFCFFSPQPPGGDVQQQRWTLEFVFICKREGRFNGHVVLAGETDRGSTTVGDWLGNLLKPMADKPRDGFHQPMRAAVNYVVKVFLYMALKQARVKEYHNYDEAMHRAAGLGERKRAKLLQRAASLYNGILVGPEFLPGAASGNAAGSGMENGVTPHWRRGHFRMQPHGPGNQQRKLIFVAPVLIHADKLEGEVPAPKDYRAEAPEAV